MFFLPRSGLLEHLCSAERKEHAPADTRRYKPRRAKTYLSDQAHGGICMVTSPTFLYRAFEEEQHAEDFVKLGKFRLGLMDTYKSIEDRSRRDRREGMSSSYVKTSVTEVKISRETNEVIGTESVPGRLHVRGTFIEPIYLLCTSGPTVDLTRLKKELGSWVVRINNPSCFLSELCNAIPTNPNIELGKCSMEAVSYTKDEDVDIDPDSFESVGLNWIQKPRDLDWQCEYRYVVKTRRVVGREPDSHLFYDFNAAILYAEILKAHL